MKERPLFLVVVWWAVVTPFSKTWKEDGQRLKKTPPPPTLEFVYWRKTFPTLL